ncbi:PAS domain-containing sensor histidine kinase [Blastopirellula sp. JC732]|uniref:histidine kinase n=1 Tax=Blastopirellula sediminis TaxID=2894196 RepID=A0A9X1MMQ2_9BACT|nr:ATP-binding protein [Blastopirellula sediminis]MCC9608491.1 PAS domain-containing sensor histidine kinase [Blastopirellula sediminis]MCC9628732.1 PAS domain-containing sensor histidine kinase [Blastopirellula sediminis]
MFRVRPNGSERSFRRAIVTLLALILTAFLATAWVMGDLFFRESQILHDLLRELPPKLETQGEALEGQLRWTIRLSVLAILNLAVTAVAIYLLWRAYRNSQDSLRDVKALAADILSSMDQAVITTDLRGAVTSVNARAMEMLSVTDACVGQSLDALSPSLSLDELRIEAEANPPSQLVRDFPVATASSQRTLRAYCQPLQNHEEMNIGSVIQLQDVTERVLLDEQMLRMERFMGLGSLAAGLHHEIKNPLSALSLHIQLLEEQLAASQRSDEVNESLEVIQTEIVRIGGVLENFRDYAMSQHLSLSPVDVSEVCIRQTRLFQPRAKAANVEIRIETSPSELPKISADRVRLEQVLLNLLINAEEAMRDGGVLTVRTFLHESGSAVVIQVIDTGIGIPEGMQTRIFDPYFTTKSAGTGMGLAITDKIVRQHNGELQCWNSTEGTIFQVTLPVTHSGAED